MFVDSLKIGVGTPIALNEGYLFIYHGVDEAKHYSLGAALLDKSNPEKCFSGQRNRYTHAKVTNASATCRTWFSACGNVQLDDQVIVYYGGADRVLCEEANELNQSFQKNSVTNQLSH